MLPRRVHFLLSFVLILTGCAGMLATTPQINLDSSDKKMEVKSKVSGVGTLDYSPDGINLVSGGLLPSLRIWDVANAKGVRIIPFPVEYGVLDTAYSPDGKLLAGSGRKGLISGDVTKLWDAASGQEVRTIAGDFGGFLSFSPDGKFLLGTALKGGLFDLSHVTKLADTQTGQVLKEFEGYRHGAISLDGRYIILAGSAGRSKEQHIRLLDIKTGLEIWRNSFGRTDSIIFSPDSKHILASHSEFKGALGSQANISVVLLDIATGKQVKEIIRFSVDGTLLAHEKEYQKIKNLTVSPDGTLVLTANERGEYKLWNIATGTLIRQLKRPDEKLILDVSPAHAAFSPNGKLIAISSAASLRLYNVASGDEAAAMIAFDDGEWLVTTPSGYYNSSEKGDEYLSVSVAGQPFSISQLRESFYRPDLVKVALSGGTLNDYKKIADIKPPPVVTIVDTPATTTNSTITVSLQVKEQGGGIGDVRLYRNGTAVVMEKSRNKATTVNDRGNQILRYNVSLEPGTNTIRAIAFNADNSMQSTDAIADVKASISAKPPALYAIVVGIKDFANPRLALTYPVADAQLFATTLEEKGQGLYSAIHVRRLLKPEETTNTAIVAALRQAQRDVGPEDLFVFYVASHGTIDDGQYLLITSNVGSTSTARLKQDALTQDALKELIANIPASKKLVVLDTCSAGQMGDAIQVAMLTRGMSDDTAMKVLSRAVGSTVLSAATSVQEALEGYKGHGLFTYVIVEGLKGAADANKDGFVKTLELADYVDTQVPELADTVFKHKQYPIVSPTGQGFPLVKVR